MSERDYLKVAYIQQQYGNWLNENCYAAAYGFGRMGYKIQPFELANADSLDIHAHDVVHGGINGVIKALTSIGGKVPEALNPLEHLPNYLGRQVEVITVGDLKSRFFDSTIVLPSFVKPLKDNKAFDGFVMTNESDSFRLNGLPDEYWLLVSEYVKFVSEYRCFVNRGELIGAKHYTGDFKLTPWWETIERAINDFKDAPVSYTLDFGITDNGYTQLIEINDGFGLASYGLNPISYCRFIKDRWESFVKELSS